MTILGRTFIKIRIAMYEFVIFLYFYSVAEKASIIFV